MTSSAIIEPHSPSTPSRVDVHGVSLDVDRPLVITGLRATGEYVVVLRGQVRFLTPKSLEQLLVLAWSAYSNRLEGWWHYATSDEPSAVYQRIRRLRDQLKDRPLIYSDRRGCYRLTLPWNEIQWHVQSLRTIVDETLSKVLRRVFDALGVHDSPPPTSAAEDS